MGTICLMPLPTSRFLLCVTLLCVAADAALILQEGPLKDSASALDSARAEQARQEQHVVGPADAVELPAVKTLEILRSTPIHDLEACAVKGFCSNTLAGRLADFSAHRGAVELVDAMAANFCLKSPFSSQLAFCRTHHFEGMRPDTQDHHDAEYKNLDVVYCMLDMPKCDPAVRTHLDALLHDKVTIRSLAAIVRFVCRTQQWPYAKDLLSCKVERIKAK